MPDTKTQRRKAKKKDGERRHEDHVYKDGTMFGNYVVYDDGRVDLQPLLTGVKHLQDEANALHDLNKMFLAFIEKKNDRFIRQRREYWENFERELKAIGVVMDRERFIYGIDQKTGFMTKIPVPEKKPVPEATP